MVQSVGLNTIHPMDTSRILMSLLSFVEQDGPKTELDHVIPLHVLRTLLSALHFRDVNTLKHSRRVALLGVGMASRLGWEEEDQRAIEIAALLHDIGKIGVPDHILHKPGKLALDETEYIAVFHRVTVELLQACHAHHDVIQIIAESHGIALHEQTEPTQGARILAVADAFDSLTNDQTFRKSFSKEKAFKMLEGQSGKQFDRNVVAALGRWLESDESQVLAENEAAEKSIQANAPVDEETRTHAWIIAQLFNYLYVLENLYQGFYVVNAENKVVIWNNGLARLTGHQAKDVIGRKWNRALLNGKTSRPQLDPMDECLSGGSPICHLFSYNDPEEGRRELDAQCIPIKNEAGIVHGAMEVLCTANESKQHHGQFRELKQAATRDALTGVCNRGELEAKLEAVFEQWQQDPANLFSVVFFDLDHFKAINDRLSHGVGDRVLIDVSRMVEDELYSGEVIGRYGGEEFVVVCPETDLDAAIERAERIRRLIMNARVADRNDLRVTASFGVAQVSAGDDCANLLKRADLALYDAKRSGRNRTCHRVPEEKSNAEKRTEKLGKDWIYTNEFVVCIASDLLHYKLNGFFHDCAAKIIKIQPEFMVYQSGSGGLFGGWGTTQDRQPVRISIEVKPIPGAVSVNPQMLIKTVAEPVGKPKQPEVFQTRAHRAVEELRSYLMGG